MPWLAVFGFNRPDSGWPEATKPREAPGAPSKAWLAALPGEHRNRGAFEKGTGNSVFLPRRRALSLLFEPSRARYAAGAKRLSISSARNRCGDRPD